MTEPSVLAALIVDIVRWLTVVSSLIATVGLFAVVRKLLVDTRNNWAKTGRKLLPLVLVVGVLAPSLEAVLTDAPPPIRMSALVILYARCLVVVPAAVTFVGWAITQPPPWRWRSWQRSGLHSTS